MLAFSKSEYLCFGLNIICFSSIVNFLLFLFSQACTDALLKAVYLNSATSVLENPTGVKYPFIKVSALCSQDV